MTDKRPDPELINEDNPEWTAQEIACARPASEVLPRLFGASAANEMLKPRGQPHAEVAKDRNAIRLKSLEKQRRGPAHRD